MAKSNLPAEVHDHFRKANVLHGYVEKGLAEATQHALETGRELLAAKAATPHGRWEPECERLFDGSLRTAQAYMRFVKHVSALPKAQASALLLTEGTLEGAAKAARKAATPEAPEEPIDEPEPLESVLPEQDDEPEDEEPETDEPVWDEPEDDEQDDEPDDKPELGKCPNCHGTKWDEDDEGVSCSKCHHPWGEPAGDVDADRLNTQRQKTVKTVEALMRAFDTLQEMLARPEHGEAIDDCKRLLRIAKQWK